MQSEELDPENEPDVRVHFGSLFRMLRRLAESFSSPDPEVAAQETLILATKDKAAGPTMNYICQGIVPEGGREGLWALGQLYAWLKTTLRHIVIRQRQRDWRLVRIDGAEGNPTGDFRDERIDVEREVATKQELAALEECVAGLPENYQRAIRLRLKGMNYKEIAAALEALPNTVATWLARALADLAACMNGKNLRR